MGCSDSNSVETNYKNSNYANDNVDTDDFFEGDYPFFQPNYYDKNIKNIKKYYVERINEGNKIRVKIHKILILMNYEEKNTTTIQIEIEKLDGRAINKHLTQLFYNECSFDNVRSLIEIYNSTFKIDSREWYKSKSSSDIYIRVEKINNYFFKIFEMFYEKDISRLILNKIIKYGNSELSSEAICSNSSPGDVVKRYNNLKLIFYDYKPEIFDYVEEPYESEELNNYNYSNNKNYSNNSNNYNNNYGSSEGQSKKRRGNATFYQDGQQVGRVYDDGTIYKDCRQVGKFYDDGTVYKDGHQDAKIYNDGTIYQDGHQALKVYSDGDVYKDGSKVGHIYDDGDVYKDGTKIGNASGMSKTEAAYLYFL
jgi:hypothetical protein